MKIQTNTIKLETGYILAEFLNSAGIENLWSKQPVAGFNYTEFNGVSTEGYILAQSVDSFQIEVMGHTFSGSSFTWVAYATDLLALNAYGRLWTGDPDATVPAVKTVTGTIKDLGGGRKLTRIENLFYPTIDGKGIIRKTEVFVSKTGDDPDQVNGLVVSIAAGGSNANRERLNVVYHGIESEQAGFDYDSIGALTVDWSFDSGINYSLARNGIYPNLCPPFTDPAWQYSGNVSVNNGVSLTIGEGGLARCWIKQSFPQNEDTSSGRNTCFSFDVASRTSGANLRGRMGINSKLNKVEYTFENNWVATGVKVMRVVPGMLNECCFIELTSTVGTNTVTNPVLQAKRTASYVPYSENFLSTNGWWNCIQVTGSNLSGKKIRRDFGATYDVRLSDCFGVWILPLNLHDPYPAFRYFFVKPDDSIVYSHNLGIWLDYNEKYLNQAARFNYWNDGFYFEFLPEGVTHIKGIGIEFLTDEPVDWLLDHFFFYTWKAAHLGHGSRQSRHIGTPAENNRQKLTALAPYLIQEIPRKTAEMMDKVQIVVTFEYDGSWYVDNSKLSHTGPVSNVEVYSLESMDWSGTLQSAADYGDVLTFALPSDAFIPVSIGNDTRGNTLTARDYDESTKVVTVDVSEKTHELTDSITVTYLRKSVVSPINYNLIFEAPYWKLDWQKTAWVQNQNNKTFFVTYNVPNRADPKVWLMACGCRQTTRVEKSIVELDDGPPTMTIYNKLLLHREGNTLGETYFLYYPVVGEDDVTAVYDQAEAIFKEASAIQTKSRREPVRPVPRNFHLTPHVSFAGEYVSEETQYFLDLVDLYVNQADIMNCITSGGSLSACKARLRDVWYGWASPLRDSGVDYIAGVREIMRRGYTPEVVANNLNRHRYLIETTIFDAKWLIKHREQLAVDTSGELRLKRIWYYEADDPHYYYAPQHNWDDFKPEYYDPIVLEGRTYTFRYQYLHCYPALWSILTSGADWGDNVTTIYDLWKKQAKAFIEEFDCDGLIFSEFVTSYRYACAERDLELYNNWRAAQDPPLPHLDSWPTDAGGKYIIDDADLWDWKCWQTNKAMGELGSYIRSLGALLGISAEVEPINDVQNINAPVWTGFTKAQKGSSWYVRELTQNCRRYGEDYRQLLSAGRCDFLYVWLYYRYCPPEWFYDVVDDFVAEYMDLREKLIVCIGAYPGSDPPESAQEIQTAMLKLINAGYQIAYAGHPRIWEWEIYREMWPWFRSFTPLVRMAGSGRVKIDPKRVKSIPFLVRDM